MKSDEIHYHLKGLPGLKEVLEVANEIKSETGLTPDVIRYRNGSNISYNQQDVTTLLKGSMNEQKYIEKNIITI